MSEKIKKQVQAAIAKKMPKPGPATALEELSMEGGDDTEDGGSTSTRPSKRESDEDSDDDDTELPEKVNGPPEKKAKIV